MLMMEEIIIHSHRDLKKAARQFISFMGNHTVFAFYGNMGAGKTTFIKEICETLGVRENITSPTFAIVNEYITEEAIPIYHFDCYRLKDKNEALDFGADDYLYSGNLCFIEWPEIIESLLPDDCVSVNIDVLPDETRKVTIKM